MEWVAAAERDNPNISQEGLHKIQDATSNTITNILRRIRTANDYNTRNFSTYKTGIDREYLGISNWVILRVFENRVLRGIYWTE
jgi:hypothetical protein